MPSGGNNRFNATEIHRRILEVHKDKDWKFPFLKIEVTDRATSKLTVDCPRHGRSQVFVRYVIGKSHSGCPGCGAAKPRKHSLESFLETARKVHGDRYDYSKAVFVQISGKMTIICRLHGPFQQSADSHMRGRGCAKCGRISAGKIFAGRPQSNLKQVRTVKRGRYHFHVESSAEEIALDRILKHYPARDLKDQRYVPRIAYEFCGMESLHRPDFMIPANNTLIEVKSPATMGLAKAWRDWDPKKTLSRIMAKVTAAQEQGYDYRVILVVGRGSKADAYLLPRGWEATHRTPRRVRKLLGLDFGDNNG